MTDSPFVLEVTEQSFQQSVLDNSHRVPVLVDFWAEWCGPCQMQLPILLKLAEEYEGKFLLAKINTDQERGLAGQFGIRSIPNMKLFLNGEVAEDILGAQTESVLRATLEHYIERESDKIRKQALEVAAAGNTERALEILHGAATDDPDNTRIKLDLAYLEIKQGHLDKARTAIETLPRDARDEADAKRVIALLEIAQGIESDLSEKELVQRIANDEGDMQARLALAGRYALAERYESAMDQYLEIIRRDRDFNEDAGRKGMLAMFELLCNEGELVSRYRRQMSNLLL